MSVIVEEARYTLTVDGNGAIEIVGGSPARFQDLTDVNATGIASGKGPVYDGSEFDMVTLVVQTAPTSKVFADSPYTAVVADDVILCNATGGAMTVNLPAASGKAGKKLTIKKTDVSANAVTIDGNASETIDGATTQSIGSQWEAVTIVCDGTNWQIVAWYAGTPL